MCMIVAAEHACRFMEELTMVLNEGQYVEPTSLFILGDVL